VRALSREWLSRSCRIAHHRRPGTNVAGHHAARPHDSVVADADTGKHDGAAADPYLRPDGDRPAESHLLSAPLGVTRMVGGKKLDAGADGREVTDQTGSTSRMTQLKFRNAPSPMDMLCP
jgi:hypothetical protein